MTLRVNDVSLAVGNAGNTNAVFTVSLSRARQAPVTVRYTTADATAQAGVDYQARAACSLSPGAQHLLSAERVTPTPARDVACGHTDRIDRGEIDGWLRLLG